MSATTDRDRYLGELDAALAPYRAAHDVLFRFNIRRYLPVPGLFLPTDYGALALDLAALSGRLEDELGQPPGRGRDNKLLRRYTQLCRQAVGELHHICTRLDARARGALDAYPKSEFDRDRRRYQDLVQSLRALRASLED